MQGILQPEKEVGCIWITAASRMHIVKHLQCAVKSDFSFSKPVEKPVQLQKYMYQIGL